MSGNRLPDTVQLAFPDLLRQLPALRQAACQDGGNNIDSKL